jgi:hypothetical protein
LAELLLEAVDVQALAMNNTPAMACTLQGVADNLRRDLKANV